MERKNSGKVREFCQFGKVGAMIGVNREVQWNQPGRVIVEGQTWHHSYQ